MALISPITFFAWLADIAEGNEPQNNGQNKNNCSDMLPDIDPWLMIKPNARPLFGVQVIDNTGVGVVEQVE